MRAEGEKRAAILSAEGKAEAIKKVADADKYQKLTVAEGEGQAIERIFAAIHNGNPTKDLIAIKYLEALEKMANGQATKLFVPYEAMATMSSLGVIKEIFGKSAE